METQNYDLAVIGSGPAGQKGAIAGAKLGKRVVLIDKRSLLGGVSLHSGTIPSKTLREVILYLTGFRLRSFYGKNYTLKERVTIGELQERVRTVIQREYDVVVSQLRRNEITVLSGLAQFVDANTLQVTGEEGDHLVRADRILIACGTRPARGANVPIDGKRIIVADQLGDVEDLPRQMIIVGAGVIGLEYASMFAALGITVTVIEQRPTVLDFCDEELIESLLVYMREQGTTFKLGEKVTRTWEDEAGKVHAETESGKTIHGDLMLYTVGRQANTDTLDLAKAGITADDRGRLAVNQAFQTSAPHIYAAGDVIGFPALASTSMEQGRAAVQCMFSTNECRVLANLPYGIYTIPEMSMVGKTERELTASKTPYEVGMARFAEIAKGQMVGASTGMLKILFDPKSLELLGIHVIGENAAEIIHIGQAVLALKGTLAYFRDAVFNYPTFAEAYKVAALNGLNKL